MKRYLLFCEGFGAILTFKMGEMTSGDFGQIYEAFETQIKRTGYCGVVELDEQQCKSGVYWDWELAGPGGASYRIHILPGVSDAAVGECKEHIRRSYDCIRMPINRIHKLIDFKMPKLKHEETR